MKKIKSKLSRPVKYFLSKLSKFSSKDYWEKNYIKGGNSGAGSYGRLAEFKAGVINKFVKDNNIQAVIEFGCGDGNQLSHLNIPGYVGFDVSQYILKHCIQKFSDDKTKSFFLYDPQCFVDNEKKFQSELTLSLDVIFHLVEHEVFEKYMLNLFNCSNKYVIIYSSNTDKQERFQPKHVYHRQFTLWVEKNFPGWKLMKVLENIYPLKTNDQIESFADFYIYSKQ